MKAGKIFINYRREDSRADAGRLYDRLHALYPDRVFRDVGSLEPGIEWREAIDKVLSNADACIVVIGKNWLTMTDAAGKRRLDDPQGHGPAGAPDRADERHARLPTPRGRRQDAGRRRAAGRAAGARAAERARGQRTGLERGFREARCGARESAGLVRGKARGRPDLARRSTQSADRSRLSSSSASPRQCSGTAGQPGPPNPRRFGRPVAPVANDVKQPDVKPAPGALQTAEAQTAPSPPPARVERPRAVTPPPAVTRTRRPRRLSPRRRRRAGRPMPITRRTPCRQDASSRRGTTRRSTGRSRHSRPANQGRSTSWSASTTPS